jgi:hypothetical protein
MKVERFASSELAKEFAKTLENKGVIAKVYKHPRGKRDKEPFVVLKDISTT